MTGEDGDRDASEDDALEGGDGEGGAAAVDDGEPDESAGSGRDPLGDLRERVVDEGGARAPAAPFPEDASAAAGDRDGRDGGDATADDAESEPAAERDGASANGEPTVPETGRDGPLGDLAAGIDGRRERQTTADDALFDEVDVGEVDADELWSQVESEGPTVEPRGDREVREVAKRKYCSQCPYFSDPPEVACSHEGTDILQQVDMEHFEVADCPVVLEDERLEDVTTE
jgi:hypothetical protein